MRLRGVLRPQAARYRRAGSRGSMASPLGRSRPRAAARASSAPRRRWSDRARRASELPSRCAARRPGRARRFESRARRQAKGCAPSIPAFFSDQCSPPSVDLKTPRAEAGDVERARGIAQDVGGGGLRHAVVLHAPGAAAIVAAHHAAVVSIGRRACATSWDAADRACRSSRPTCGRARRDRTPSSRSCCSHCARHAVARGAVPAVAAVIAGPEADIGVADEHVARDRRGRSGRRSRW